MGLRFFSKSERRGFVLLLVLLTAIVVGMWVRQNTSGIDSDDINDEVEAFYREIRVYNDSVNAQFDTIAAKQKQSTKELRRKNKKGKKAKSQPKTYPTRDFHNQPIPTKQE